jgi:AraC family transcriptional activator of pobA
LVKEQQSFVSTVFQKMILEQGADYTFKDQLIYDWMSLIIHEAVKIKTENGFLL